MTLLLSTLTASAKRLTFVHIFLLSLLPVLPFYYYYYYYLNDFN